MALDPAARLLATKHHAKKTAPPPLSSWTFAPLASLLANLGKRSVKAPALHTAVSPGSRTARVAPPNQSSGRAAMRAGAHVRNETENRVAVTRAVAALRSTNGCRCSERALRANHLPRHQSWPRRAGPRICVRHQFRRRYRYRRARRGPCRRCGATLTDAQRKDGRGKAT